MIISLLVSFSQSDLQLKHDVVVISIELLGQLKGFLVRVEGLVVLVLA